MTDPSKPAKSPGPRLQHVVAHIAGPTIDKFDEVVVFGQEIDALRHIVGKQGWVYAPVAHGQSFTQALKAAQA